MHRPPLLRPCSWRRDFPSAVDCLVLGAAILAAILSLGACAGDAVSSATEARLPDEEEFHLVQLGGVAQPQTRRELAAHGVRLLRRRGHGWWLAAGPRTLRRAPSAPLLTSARLGAALQRRLAERRAETPSTPLSAWVLLCEPPRDEDETLRLLTAAGGSARRVGFAPIYEVRGFAAALARVAELKAVCLVDLSPGPAIPLLDRTREAIGVEPLHDFQLTPEPRYALGGAKTVAGIWDPEGVDPAHPDLAANLLRYPDPTLASSLQHGTTVAGCLAGTGSESHRSPAHPWAPYQLRGIAPQAKLAVYLTEKDVDEEGNVTSFLEQYLDAVNNFGIDAANFSFSYSSRAVYDVTAANFDFLVAREDATLPAALPLVVATGNHGEEIGYGSVSSLAAAKNVLAVGASDWANGGMAPFSSFGPTADGRIKPELVAPGHGGHGATRIGFDFIRLVSATAPPVEWSFDEAAEGWSAAGNLIDVSAKDGFLEMTTSGDGPQLAGPSNLALAATTYPKLQIALRSMHHHAAVLLWRTDKAPSFSSARMLPFLINADGALHTYEVDLAAHAGWKDTIQQLAIFPSAMGLAVPMPGGTYGVLSGTSLSSAIVTGGLLLLIQTWREVLKDEDPRPPPALLKAILVATARDIVGEGPPSPQLGGAPTPCPNGPDFATGYGEVDLYRAAELIRAAGAGRRAFAEAEIAETGQKITWRLQLARARSLPLTVTLAWDDPAGMPGSDEVLQNDLDLEVKTPSGETIRPWVLDPAHPERPAAQGIDRHNNLEQVLVPAASAGEYLLTVSGYELARGPQSFALVISDPSAVERLVADRDPQTPAEVPSDASSTGDGGIGSDAANGDAVEGCTCQTSARSGRPTLGLLVLIVGVLLGHSLRRHRGGRRRSESSRAGGERRR